MDPIAIRPIWIGNRAIRAESEMLANPGMLAPCPLCLIFAWMFLMAYNVFDPNANIAPCEDPVISDTGWLPQALTVTNQVWSLTQFYSVDFSQLRISVKCAFSTNAQSRFASVVVDGVLGPPRLARHTWRCPCISVVPEATHEASRGPEKGAVSAQKALRGSETETRELLGGTEENSVSPMRGHWFALQANQWFFTKRKQKKIELVARPGIVVAFVLF